MDRLTALQVGGRGLESLKAFGQPQINEKALAKMQGLLCVLILPMWRAR